MQSVEMRMLVDRYIDAYNRKDVAAMLLTVSPDVAFQNIAGGTVNASTSGRTQLAALAEQSLPLFAERHQEILSFDIHDGGAVAAIRFRAVVARDLPNGLKQGQEVVMAGRSEFAFRDGAICKITDIC